MKLFDTLLLALGAACIIIAAYEVMAVGLGFAYPFIMLAVISLIWFSYRKKVKN